MRTTTLIALVLATPIACNAEPELNTPAQKASYGFGANYARQLESQGINLDIQAFTRGMRDVAAGKELALNDEDMKQAMMDFQNTLRAEMQQKQEEAATRNLAEGTAFLEQNAKKEGVKTTESGLQYEVIESGDGPSPDLEDTVVTHYRGTLIDGREFDSSYKRGEPATFPVNGVIEGWTEALQMMHVGDKWKLYVPSDLAYGPQKRSELIQPNTTLIFDIELLEVKGKGEKDKKS